MRNIVVADLNQIDFQTSFQRPKIIDSVNDLTEKEGTFLINKSNMNEGLKKEGNLFIPSTLLEQTYEGVQVYFELEQYPFFQKAKEMITDPKGVLRFRRKVRNEKSNGLPASDLFVLTSILGEPEDVQLKGTKQEVKPYHLIITVNFGSGTMAHLEYTFSDEDERIEFDWSGIQNIIEFDSKEMNPIDPKGYSRLPLLYSTDSILSAAHKADQNLIKRLIKYCGLLNGGVK